MKQRATYFLMKQILVIAMAATLISCGGSGKGGGGGGGVGPTGEPTTLKGTVAVGTALINTQVFAKDNKGNQVNATTDANGKFSITFPEFNPPYLLKVIAPGNQNLYSYAVSNGAAVSTTTLVVNIHPLADLVTRNLFKSGGYDVDTVFSTSAGLENSLSASKAETVTAAFVKLLALIYQSYAIPVAFDFLRADFDANDRFWALLANLRVTIVADNVSVAFVDPTSLTTYVFVQLNLTFDFTQIDQTAPTIPNNVNPIPSPTSMTITWDAATDNVGVAGYELYRGSSKIATLAYAAYKDSGLQELTEYCYSVVAVDGSGNSSAKSTLVCKTTLKSPDVTAPAPVTGVVAVAESSSSIIKITWNASPEADVVGYRITRKTGATYSEISKVTALSYVDIGLDASTEYCYRVDAYDAANNYSLTGTEPWPCATTPIITTPDVTPPVTVASPPSGAYTSVQNISLACTDTGGSGCSKTYFTVDGTEPTVASPVYVSPIVIAVNTTLKFFSVDNQGNVEATKIANYSVVLPPKAVLEVVKNDASGLVTSSVAGINCGVTCKAEYAINTDVVLTATHSAGLVPIWSGCASTSVGLCTIKMDRMHRVAVTFAVAVAESASNDTFDTAQLISASSIVSGYYHAATDEDYYRIVVAAQGTLHATLSHATVNSYLVLFNELKAQITSTYGTAHLLTQSLSPGVYYLKVVPYRGFDLTAPYDLKLIW